jgi:hypothetical protein
MGAAAASTRAHPEPPVSHNADMRFLQIISSVDAASRGWARAGPGAQARRQYRPVGRRASPPPCHKSPPRKPGRNNRGKGTARKRAAKIGPLGGAQARRPKSTARKRAAKKRHGAQARRTHTSPRPEHPGGTTTGRASAPRTNRRKKGKRASAPAARPRRVHLQTRTNQATRAARHNL